ncbi:MAG: hypothetical protein ACTSVV_18185 [Promethearchaeota archaeon]
MEIKKKKLKIKIKTILNTHIFKKFLQFLHHLSSRVIQFVRDVKEILFPQIYSIEIQDLEQLKFPKICILCGNYTDKNYIKNLDAPYNFTTKEKKRYFIKIPICFQCQTRISRENLQLSILDKKFMKYVILGTGLTISIIISILTFSIFFGVAIFLIYTISILLLYEWKFSADYKVRLSDFVKFELYNLGKSLKLKMYNKHYIDFLKSL